MKAGPAGIATDTGLRSVTNPLVYAVGDIADPAGLGPRQFTHVGSQHASLVIRRMLFRLPAKLSYAALPRVTYTDPELAQIGLTEAEARKAGTGVSVLHWQVAENDRAQTERHAAGRIKLVVSGGRIVGAGIIARHAGEMAAFWGLAIASRQKLSTLAGPRGALPDALRNRQTRRRLRLYRPAVLRPHPRPGPRPRVAAVTGRPTPERLAIWHQARLALHVAAAGRLIHDVRGALAPILLTAERLQGHAEPAVRRGGEIAARSVERAEAFLAEAVPLLALGPKRTPTELRGIADRLAARHAGVVAVAGDGRAGVDPAALEQALAELVTNAVAAGARRVTLTLALTDGVCRVEVADDGPGLPVPDFAPHPGGRPRPRHRRGADRLPGRRTQAGQSGRHWNASAGDSARRPLNRRFPPN